MTAQSKSSLKGMLPMIWPIFLELLLQILVGYVDQLMIANVRQDAIGAIANANQVLNILLFVFSMISMATTILIAQYRGAGEDDQIPKVITLSCAVNLLLGLTAGSVIGACSGAFFRLMRVPDVFLAPASEYLHIVGGFCFLQSLSLTLSAVFRSHKLMRQSMLVSVSMNLVNIVGNALLIYGIGPFPALGVRGVAIATVVSRLTGLMLFGVLVHRHFRGCVSLAHLRPFPWTLLRQIFRIGIPAGGESFSYNITQVIILTMVNSFGPDATTAKSYCSMISSFALLYCQSVSQVTQIVVGYHVGAHDFDAADRVARAAALSSLLVTTSLSFFVYLMCSPIFSLFGASEAVKALCRQVMCIEVFRQFGRSFNMLYLFALQGAGDIRFPIAVGIADSWIMVIGGGYILGCVMGFGLCGIWFAMALDENIRGTIFVLRWRKGTWKYRSILEKGHGGGEAGRE